MQRLGLWIFNTKTHTHTHPHPHTHPKPVTIWQSLLYNIMVFFVLPSTKEQIADIHVIDNF
jgi:hypothetical protein